MQGGVVSNLTIGKIAKLAGVGVETIRFYEREGLITRPEEPKSGYRKYTQDVVLKIHFIKRAKDLGFSLAETRDLLDIKMSGSKKSCQMAQKKAIAKIDEIQNKIDTLTKMKETLEKLSYQECKPNDDLDECPILNAIEQDSDAA